MAKFRLDSIARLARQLEFAPQGVRGEQLDRAEELLHLIDPAKAYPLDFVVYRITDYRPKKPAEELLTGLALQHDLGLLIEQVSCGLRMQTISLDEPVLQIEDVCEKFNVTSKTIQRWRRKGLPARRFVFPDGKLRVGFRLGSVERFLAGHTQQAAAGNASQVEAEEMGRILRHARRLVSGGCCVSLLSRRIARRVRRSPLTILHTLKKHDQENPGAAILPLADGGADDGQRARILEAHAQGAGVAELARELGLPRVEIYRVILERRIARLSRRRVKFFDDVLFHQHGAAGVIEALARQEELPEEPKREDLRVPRDLPPFLRELYRTPLLTRSGERALFLKLNFHRFQFAQARRRLDPELARHRDLKVLEGHLARAAETRNAIIRANLRLVVSVARRHVRAGVGLLELVSEGNLSLMRAVDGFDVNRGNRFSTYATLALMKGFARAAPQMAARRAAGVSDLAALHALADTREDGAMSRLIDREQVGELLSRLCEREREIIASRFALGERRDAETYEQVSLRMGLPREAVRRIEQSAMRKLRLAAEA